MEEILFEFAGASAVVDHGTVETHIRRVGIEDERVPHVINRLRELSFLGIEVKEGSFSYAERGRDFRKLDALARKLAESARRQVRYEIHAAYRPYLEIEESSPLGLANEGV